MPLRSDQCICLRRFEYSETSQILALFGRDFGLFRVIAKGAHRRTKAGESRFDGGVDLLDEGSAVMTDPTAKELATLTEWKLAEGHLSLRKDLRAMCLALYGAEMLSIIIRENDPHPELFELMQWLLSVLPTPQMEESFIAFQLELLNQAGFLPELGLCATCGQPIETGKVLFSPGAGGMVCQNCPRPQGPVIASDARLTRMLQTISRLPKSNGIPQRLPKLTRAQSNPVNRLLGDYIRYTLDQDLRSAAFVYR